MARTIAVIRQSIIDAKNGINPMLPLTGDNPLAALNSTSSVALWRLWVYVTAVSIWALENLFDYHKAEVANLIGTEKPHTLQWYVGKARAFRYGYALAPDSDHYAVTLSDPAANVVKYAAATELDTQIRIKAATTTGGDDLAPLSGPQLAALTAYMNRVKDAGVRMQITSGNPDKLRLALRIYYDPLVLDALGARLDGTAADPIKTVVGQFLTSLPFNGLFVVSLLVSALQAVDGVVNSEVVGAMATYGSLPYVGIVSEYLPDSGYMVLETGGLTIAYLPHAPI